MHLTPDQIAAFAVLAGVLVLFIGGWLRYDLVAFAALIISVLLGIVPSHEAFSGFGHPAVITVALVLMLSEALYQSGAIDILSDKVVPNTSSPTLLIAGLAGLAAVLSGIMNNVGALALLMPVALQASRRSDISPALILMPLSFGSILGGMTTLIGTPPNIIVANYRAAGADAPFSMFDYSWIGVPVALIGVLFVTLIGWRLIPKARSSKTAGESLFDLKPYITEVRVTEKSSLAGEFMLAVNDRFAELDGTVVGLIRGETLIPNPAMTERMQVGDILVVSADAESLDKATSSLGLELVGQEDIPQESIRSDRVSLIEAVIIPGSRMSGKTASNLGLRQRFKLNLLAVARAGKRTFTRLRNHRFRAGDVLLLQGDTDQVYESLNRLGALPLAQRSLRVGKRRRALFTVGLFAAAIAAAGIGMMSITVAFGIAISGMIVGRILSPSRAYGAIEFPVIVLLACMIPVGQALDTTGAAQIIADSIVSVTQAFPAFVALTLVMVVTMTLSDIMNNAATAVVMAPIAAKIADEMGVNTDPFLMAVAIGASCAFLTPIGHQNNTLVLGPGGYSFGDYWRMGLPLEILVVAVSVPLLLVVWPL